jgi:hypothetical protein
VQEGAPSDVRCLPAASRPRTAHAPAARSQAGGLGRGPRRGPRRGRRPAEGTRAHAPAAWAPQPSRVPPAVHHRRLSLWSAAVLARQLPPGQGTLSDTGGTDDLCVFRLQSARRTEEDRGLWAPEVGVFSVCPGFAGKLVVVIVVFIVLTIWKT